MLVRIFPDLFLQQGKIVLTKGAFFLVVKNQKSKTNMNFLFLPQKIILTTIIYTTNLY